MFRRLLYRANSPSTCWYPSPVPLECFDNVTRSSAYDIAYLMLYNTNPLGNILMYTFGMIMLWKWPSFSFEKNKSGIHTRLASVSVRYFILPGKNIDSYCFVCHIVAVCARAFGNHNVVNVVRCTNNWQKIRSWNIWNTILRFGV